MGFTFLVIWIWRCPRVANLGEEANAILAHGGELGQPLMGSTESVGWWRTNKLRAPSK